MPRDLPFSVVTKPTSAACKLGCTYYFFLSKDLPYNSDGQRQVHVQRCDTMLAARCGQYSSCVHAPKCGTGLAVEHNGDIYSCDHYVESGYQLGTIHHQKLMDVLMRELQRDIGRVKRTGLTAYQQRCAVLWACHGGCPRTVSLRQSTMNRDKTFSVKAMRSS